MDLLDRPIWNALTTRHQHFAEGAGLARRYPSDIAPFAGMRDLSLASLVDLQKLIQPGKPAGLFTVDKIVVPPGLEILLENTLEQMVCTASMDEVAGPVPVVLEQSDHAAMFGLADMVKPGPFSLRSPELGRFVGIRDAGRLVAMAGERLCLDGLTEVSAVCTHPDYRGRGYARVLSVAVSRTIASQGSIPFLHAFSDNLAAIRLYRRLGFVIRRQMHVVLLGQETSGTAR
ncbi:MAG: GNAT family N-acetyltransferase [Janthinobacterium lividum]